MCFTHCCPTVSELYADLLMPTLQAQQQAQPASQAPSNPAPAKTMSQGMSAKPTSQAPTKTSSQAHHKKNKPGSQATTTNNNSKARTADKSAVKAKSDKPAGGGKRKVQAAGASQPAKKLKVRSCSLHLLSRAALHLAAAPAAPRHLGPCNVLA
jgi:hypothetical protein